jgi:hypothetical protein
LRLQAIWDPLLIRWVGWEWSGIGQVFVESLRLLCACVAIPYDMLKLNLMGSFSLQPQSS